MDIREQEGRTRYASSARVAPPVSAQPMEERSAEPAPPDYVDRVDRGARARVLEVRRPTDGSLIAELPLTPHVEVLQAVERARSIQRQWIELAAEERFSTLARLAEAVGDNADAIAAAR
ncbi:MAG: aldehyde dehydrogenase family protein [Gemmatimonadetes bacterium]|nr:aldehyde dehydrogenase family protein [Gemmatimonadota bacterium]